MRRVHPDTNQVHRKPSAVWCSRLTLGPPLLALILASPCIAFRFLSDDFSFLQRGASVSLEQLTPDPRSVFYRPISRELYFALLSRLSPTDPLLGHVLNALFLAVVVLLITTFTRRVGGERFGLLAGSYLACLGAIPTLVGWVSGVQDLLAMLFLTVALHFEWSGKKLLAVFCAAGALLSKETAVFFLSALVSLRFIALGDRRELAGAAARYLGLIALWVAMHPRLRDLLAHGLTTGEGGYVGIDNPRILDNAMKTAGTFLNIPPTGWNTPWPSWTLVPLLGALAVIATLAWLERRCVPDPSPGALSKRKLLWLGVLLGIVPAVATVATTKNWFPYYASMPAMGMSILLALLARKLRWEVAMVALAAFSCLGAWYRGTGAGKTTLPAEANMRMVSTCLGKIEKSIRELHPTFPDSSRIYLALETTSELSLRFHLLDGQGIRTWYANPTLVTRPVEYQDRASWPPYLFWITQSCEIFEITLPQLGIRQVRGQPDYSSYQRALRGYAYGAWSAGDTDRGVAALLGMQEVNRMSWDFDRRLAAAFLLASGRAAEAERLYAGLPKLGRDLAVAGAGAALTTYVMRPGLDEAVFLVFGLDYGDPEAIRDLMLYFSDQVLLEKAQRMAEHLLKLRPGDEDATAMMAAIRKVPKWQDILVGPDMWAPPGSAY